jgi:hypothetical protein
MNIPEHVREYVRRDFGSVNHEVSNTYSANPNMHEEWLDGTVAVKAAILQCKRLYPGEVKQLDESSYDDYAVGFARLFPDDEALGDVLEPRTFSFSERSVYRALVLGDEQWAAIEQYEKTAIPVHYL